MQTMKENEWKHNQWKNMTAEGDYFALEKWTECGGWR